MPKDNPIGIIFAIVVILIVAFILVTSFFGEASIPACNEKLPIEINSCSYLDKFVMVYGGENQPASVLNLDSKIYTFMTVGSERVIFPINLNSCKLEFEPKANEMVFKAYSMRIAYENSNKVSFEDSAYCFGYHKQLPVSCATLDSSKDLLALAGPASNFIGTEKNLGKLLEMIKKFRTFEVDIATSVIDAVFCNKSATNLFVGYALINNIRCPLKDMQQNYFYSKEGELLLEASNALETLYYSKDFNENFIPSILSVSKRDCSKDTLRKTNRELIQILEIAVHSWQEPQQNFQKTIGSYKEASDKAIALMDANINKANEALWAKFMLTKIFLASQNSRDNAIQLYERGLFPLAEKRALEIGKIYEGWDYYSWQDWLSFLPFYIILAVAVIWWFYQHR